MPKYLVTNGSNFQPFTYDELARPLQEMAAAHNAVQDQYDTISAETAALGRYISDNPGDNEARALYDSYNNKLQSLQENLWNNGYNAGTRRDLSSARAGYASDIVRLGTAIKARQDRSAEYWKTKHDHPDMIMGEDPGTSGLDNYLNDDLYGKNWYHYSGNQFMSEVGADAKARANELVRNPEIMRDPRMAGYITRITKDGFTSEEVANASAAVKAMLNGNSSLMQSLDPASAILADVLTSHLESTGAAGKVNASEFERLFDYGRAGLSQAIGKTDIKDMSDKVWDFNKQIALQNHTHALSEASAAAKAARQSGAAGGGSGYNASGQRPYTLNDISTFMKAKNADAATKAIQDNYVKPFKNPVVLKNGQVISNPKDADKVLSGLGRSAIQEKFGGIDPESPTTGTGTVKINGNDVDIRVRQGANGIFVVQTIDRNGKWNNDESLSNEYNSMNNRYQDNLRKFKKQNPGVNLNKLVITSSDMEKIRKKNNLPDNVSEEDMPYVLATQSAIGRTTSATVAGATPDMDSTRKAYARQIFASYNRAINQQGKLRKSDESNFFPINKGVISDKGTDITTVFGKKKDGNLTEIFVYPEDLMNNRVRIDVDGKQYAINPAMLGNNMDAQIQKLRRPVQELMKPIMNPAYAINMSEDDSAQWVYMAQNLLGDYMPLVGNDGYGNVMVVTPMDIVRNPTLQEELRTAVTKLMNNVIADARDEMNLNNMQVRGNTSTKAEGYNDYIE